MFTEKRTYFNKDSKLLNLYLLSVLLSIPFNNRFLRERGMASTTTMKYQFFLCIFQKNSAMATLGLKEMGKFIMEGREKSLPVGCLSLILLNWDAQQGRLFFLPQRILPFPSNLKQPYLSSLEKCKGNTGIPFWGLMPCLFPSKICC